MGNKGFKMDGTSLNILKQQYGGGSLIRMLFKTKSAEKIYVLYRVFNF